MSLPRYPKYKASGVEWLGDVPDGWEVVPCRNIVQEQTAKNDDAKCQDYLSLMANVGVLPYSEKGDVGNKKPEDLSKCKIVRRGDFVINSMNFGIGSYGLSNFDGICSPVYIVLKPKKSIVESRFAFRIFECRSFQQYAQSFGNGILEHRSAINWDILKSIGVGLPCLQEQKQILEFLDRETGKIDGLVAEQRRLIELLKEKRQAVTLHAVTKGVDPHAPMKPSGIDWLGDVPAGWVISALKRVVHLQSGESITADGISEVGPYPVYGGNGLRGFTSEFTHNGDYVLIGRQGALCGNINYAHERFWASEHAVVATPIRAVDIFWLGEMLRTINLNQYSIAAAQPGLSVDLVGRISIPVPPFSEQKKIATYLTKETAKIDALIEEAQNAVNILQERRTALISAAVTGQIDVRNSLRN